MAMNRHLQVNISRAVVLNFQSRRFRSQALPFLVPAPLANALTALLPQLQLKRRFLELKIVQ